LRVVGHEERQTLFQSEWSSLAFLHVRQWSMVLLVSSGCQHQQFPRDDLNSRATAITKDPFG